MRRHSLWIRLALPLALLDASRDLSGDTAKTEPLIAASRELWEKFWRDPHRPRG